MVSGDLTAGEREGGMRNMRDRKTKSKQNEIRIYINKEG
jgi:hypothetical protein